MTGGDNSPYKVKKNPDFMVVEALPLQSRDVRIYFQVCSREQKKIAFT